MKSVARIAVVILVAVLGSSAPAYSQHGDKRDQQDKKENRVVGEKPGKGHEHQGQPSHPARERGVERRGPERVEHARSARQPEPRHERVIVDRRGDRVVWQEHRAREWQHEHRTWVQRGGYRGYRIPHDRYVVYFGREHRFRVHTLPVMVIEGRPRFQCRGFWFTLIDPWPEYWAASWYETDDVYVEYAHDGYYLYNTRHPGVAIAVSVSL